MGRLNGLIEFNQIRMLEALDHLNLTRDELFQVFSRGSELGDDFNGNVIIVPG